MSRIKVTNTSIIIEDYTLGENQELEKPFKKFDPIFHRFEYVGIHYDKEDKRLYLPAGIDLFWVKNKLGERYYDRIQNHPYANIDNIKIKYPPRDETQIKALQFMCDLEDENNDQYSNMKSLNLSTGAGKTYLSIATICYFSCKSIIITNSTTLLKQWNKEILKYTNLAQNDIILISGSSYCNALLKESSNRLNRAKIFLCTHGTLRSFGDTFGWKFVGLLFEKLQIGIKIFDEAHKSYANMVKINSYTNTWKTYFVTATPFRSDWKERRVYETSLKNVPAISLFDEDNDPHVHYTSILYSSNPSPADISACKNKYGLDRNKYINYVTKKPEFYQILELVTNDFILPVISPKFPKDKLNDPEYDTNDREEKKGRVIMFIGTNKGIERVYYWLINKYPELIGRIGIFTSLMSKEDKLKEREKDLILTTTKSAGEGEDIPRLRLTIVLAEPFKSEVLARQSLGRIRAKNGVYLEIVDKSFFYVKKFYQAKLPVFNKYAQSVSDSDIGKNELEIRSNKIIEDRDTWHQNVISFDHDSRFPDLDKLLPKDIIDIPDSSNTFNKAKCPVRFVKNTGKLLD